MRNPESLISTSVDDAKISLEREVESNPARCLEIIADTLHLMNAKGLEKKALRKALVSAGRKALKKLEES